MSLLKGSTKKNYRKHNNKSSPSSEESSSDNSSPETSRGSDSSSSTSVVKKKRNTSSVVLKQNVNKKKNVSSSLEENKVKRIVKLQSVKKKEASFKKKTSKIIKNNKYSSEEENENKTSSSEEESNSSSEESYTSEESSEEEVKRNIPSSKRHKKAPAQNKKKVLGSPGKRANKKRDPGILMEKGNTAPEIDGEDTSSLPREPTNTIWVVTTEKLEKPYIDEKDKSNYKARYLTAAEIAWIVDVIPMVPAAVAEVGCIVQQQLKTVKTTELMRVKVIPLGIGILRAEIEYHFYKALVEPGKTLGVTCSESVGQPLTQITLSSFHKAGAATAGVSDVNSISEMFNISPERKKEFTTIHFRDKDLSYDDVFHMNHKIGGITLSDLVKSSFFNPISGDVPPHERGWWYIMSEKIYDIDMSDDSVLVNGKTYLRIRFNKKQLYAYDITIKEIAQIISGKDDTKTCICVFSPTATGIIDVYPSKEVGAIFRAQLAKAHVGTHAYRAITEEAIEVLFLQRCIVYKMSDIIIKGVPGIKSLMPISEKLVYHLKYAEKVSMLDDGRVHGLIELLSEKEKNIIKVKLNKNQLKNYEDKLWKIWIDDIQVRMLGVPVSKLVKFIQACGITVVYAPTDIDDETYDEELSNLNPIYSQLSDDGIYVYMEESITKNNQDFKLITYLQKKLEEAKKGTSDEDKEIVKHSIYVYANASGINMQALLSNPYIDAARCHCNNFHHMLESFGIEVTRNAYIREFYEHIINNDQYLSPRYLILIAEFVTNQGFLIPVTSRGVSRQNIGSFAKASFEHAMPTLVDAAAFHKTEDVKSTSTAIFVGRRAMIGTGICQPIPDEVMLIENGKREKELGDKKEKQDMIDYTQIPDIDFVGSVELNVETDNVGTGENLFFQLHKMVGISNKEEVEKFPVWKKAKIPKVEASGLELPEWVTETPFDTKKTPSKKNEKSSTS
jgi:hypothetical protein